MAIRARCGECGGTFQAKDSLGGKKVKCPKCGKPMEIKQPVQPKTKPGSKPGGRSSSGSAAGDAYNPLADLLDEGGVKSRSRAPLCPNCSADMTPGAIICVECGFNIETGQRISTYIGEDEEDSGTADYGMTDADRLIKRAEQQIDESPDAVDPDNFGDGADSFVIAAIAGVILLVLVGIGLTTIFMMETITQYVNSGFISWLAATFLSLSMAAWITLVAFKQRPGHGIACIVTGSFWCIVYGFMQGKQLLLPTIILLFSNLVFLGAGYYCITYGVWPLTEQ